MTLRQLLDLASAARVARPKPGCGMIVGVIAFARMVLRLLADLIGLLALTVQAATINRSRKPGPAPTACALQGARSKASTYRCRDSVEPCLALAVM